MATLPSSSRLALGTAQFGLSYGIANAGGQMTLSEGAAVLSREVPVAQLDVPTFSTALERFVNLTEDWTKRLQAAESEPAADTYAPPPQGGIRA